MQTTRLGSLLITLVGLTVLLLLPPPGISQLRPNNPVGPAQPGGGDTPVIVKPTATTPISATRKAFRFNAAKPAPAAFVTALNPTRDGYLIVDASGTRKLFPLPVLPRTFSTRATFDQFLVTALGARRSGNPQKPNLSVQVHQSGSTVWVDPDRRLAYEVTDPVRAYLGGLSGRLAIGGRTVCLDPATGCRAGRRPSYLRPLTVPARQSRLGACGARERCVEYESFFNKLDLGLFKYGSHGAQSKITSGNGELSVHVCDPPRDLPVEGDPFVTAMEVVTRTGGDNLRGQNDNAFALVKLANLGGAVMEPHPELNQGHREFGNNSTNDATFLLPAGTRVSDIQSFAIQTTFGGGPSGDNWNLDGLRVTVTAGDGTRVDLVDQQKPPGQVLVRFSGELQLRTWEVTAAGGLLTLCYESIDTAFLSVASALVKHWPAERPDLGGWGITASGAAEARGNDVARVTFAGFAPPSGSTDGSLGSAPPIAEAEVDGICSAHTSSAAPSGGTGAGDHAGADEKGLCPW